MKAKTEQTPGKVHPDICSCFYITNIILLIIAVVEGISRVLDRLCSIIKELGILSYHAAFCIIGIVGYVFASVGV